MRAITSTLYIFLLIPLLQIEAADERPNVVFIMADDLGYGDLSCYGGWIETPHIDSIAENGLRLTDYHSNGNVCSPTRAALMTGLYQQKVGIPFVVVAAEKSPNHFAGIQAAESTWPEAVSYTHLTLPTNREV